MSTKIDNEEIIHILEVLKDVKGEDTECIVSMGDNFYRYDGEGLVQGTFNEDKEWEDYQ